MDNCIVCDEHVVIEFARVHDFPICSEKCVIQWNEMTDEDKWRFVECATCIQMAHIE